MTYSDIHIHALFGVDDGAGSEESMYAIIDAAYSDGTRHIIFTPHYHPGYYGKNEEQRDKAFGIARSYCEKKYPDLSLALGNELHYMRGSVDRIHEGSCRTMNGTGFVLVDFTDNEALGNIAAGLERLLNGGYRPILAHAERYSAFYGKQKELHSLKSKGVLLQMDASSAFGAFGIRAKQQSNKLLCAGLFDFVSSDAHNITDRPPVMSSCYEYISKKYSPDYAAALCRDNAQKLFFEIE